MRWVRLILSGPRSQRACVAYVHQFGHLPTNTILTDISAYSVVVEVGGEDVCVHVVPVGSRDGERGWAEELGGKEVDVMVYVVCVDEDWGDVEYAVAEIRSQFEKKIPL